MPDVDYQVEFRRPSGDGPLDHLLKHHLGSSEFHRVRFLQRFFSPFHLKNTVISSVQGRRIKVEGREAINFTSCNYLGLDQDPRVHWAAIQAIREYGHHSGCSRIFASHDNIIRLENEISILVGSEKTMMGVNTSQTHQGVIPALYSNEMSEIFVDRYAHTSLYQAGLTAQAKGAKLTRVDILKKEELIRAFDLSDRKFKVLLVDGVYSMTGDVPDLRSLQVLCAEKQVTLYIDDAHGVGICGPRGGGVVEQCRLNYQNLILTGSMQKAFGCYGGFVSGRAELIDYLRVTSKSYIFSGALQPQAVAGGLEAIKICRSSEGDLKRRKIREMSKYVRTELRAMGFHVPEGESPIIPVQAGGDLRTLMAGRKLFDSGIFVNSVLFPAVPKGEGVLRIALTALHNEDEIGKLIEAFRELKMFWDTRCQGWRENLFYFREVAKAKIQGSHYLGL